MLFNCLHYMLLSQQILEVVEEGVSFSVRFLQKSGTRYAYGQEDDVGLVKEGPPDFYSWTVLTPFDYDIRS